MPIIDWNNNYSVGVKEIDEQHQKWIGLINKLHDAMSRREGKAVLADILNEVVNYTKTHLAYEEALFEKYGYPEKETHKNIHNKLTQQVLNYQNDYNEGKSVITIEVMNFLKNWLIDHITNTDKKYTEFFNSKGLK